VNQENIKDFILTFTSIFYEALPFIILGSVIAGVLEHAIPKQWIMRFVPKNRFAAIAMSCFLGMVFPMCECGILPVMRRLLRKGLPLSCCTAYMMCGPVINPVVIISTWVAFRGYHQGWVIVAFRMGYAFLVAFVTANIIDRQHQKYGDALLTPKLRPDAKTGDKELDNDEKAVRPSVAAKVGLIAETAIHDFVDITVFLTIGALLSGFARLFFTMQQIESLGHSHPALIILAMMGLAILLCICSEADAFIAASYSTLPAAPKIAFVVLGPMLDLKLFMLFRLVYSRRVIWTIITCVVVQTFLYSLLAHYILPRGIGMTSS
jgi:uncharacterized membrane protein YraQ (UPF0718 family)